MARKAMVAKTFYVKAVDNNFSGSICIKAVEGLTMKPGKQFFYRVQIELCKVISNIDKV